MLKILHPARPLVGPDGNAGHHSYFHAPEGHRRAKRMALVNGGSRGPTPPVRGRCRAATEGVGMCGMEAGGFAEPPIAHIP